MNARLLLISGLLLSVGASQAVLAAHKVAGAGFETPSNAGYQMDPPGDQAPGMWGMFGGWSKTSTADKIKKREVAVADWKQNVQLLDQAGISKDSTLYKRVDRAFKKNQTVLENLKSGTYETMKKKAKMRARALGAKARTARGTTPRGRAQAARARVARAHAATANVPAAVAEQPELTLTERAQNYLNNLFK